MLFSIYTIQILHIVGADESTETYFYQGHCRLIFRQLEKFNKFYELEKLVLIKIIQEKAYIIKTLNEKIINHLDISELETELVDSDEYSTDLRVETTETQGEYYEIQ